MYSKMHQQKYAYKLEIQINKTKCPICKRYHLRMSTTGVITCTCGFIADNLHEYVAGTKLNNDLDFKIEKTHKKEEGDNNE